MQGTVHDNFGIAFSRKTGRILIYKATLRALGLPEYVRLLPNPKWRKLALQVCAKEETGAIRIPKSKSKCKPIIICSLVIQRMLWDMCSWEKNGNYRVYGRYFPKNEIVEFCLSDAEDIPDELFIDPECTLTP